MRLKYPILHIGSVAEIKMCNEFMKNNKPLDTNVKNLLAEIIRSLHMMAKKTSFTNCQNMLKSYSKTSAKNSDIKTKEQALVPGVNIMLL